MPPSLGAEKRPGLWRVQISTGGYQMIRTYLLPTRPASQSEHIPFTKQEQSAAFRDLLKRIREEQK
jgi:hypothetical protein